MDNISTMKKQAELLLVKLEGKRYIAGELNERLQAAAEEHPQDTVIVAVAKVFDRVAEKDPSRLVSQAEVEDIYKELVGLNASNTRFREVLGDLLLSERRESVVPDKKFVAGRRDNPDDGIVGYASDPGVAAGFEYLFQNTSDKYDPACASSAKQKVEMEFCSLGFDNSRVRLAGGNSRFLVFSADLDTNRGAVRVYVPTESSGEKLPSVFVAGNRLEQLETSALLQHISDASNHRDNLPAVSAILKTLDTLVGLNQKTMEQKDFAGVAASLKEGTEDMQAPAVFAQMPDESRTVKDVEIPAVLVPEPLRMIAQDLDEGLAEASLSYPQAAVRLAKRMVATELVSMGFSNPQVSVAYGTQDGFVCSAAIGTPKGIVKIEVPIEMKGGTPLMPSVFAKDDYVADFNTASLQAFVIGAGRSGGTIVRDRQLYTMDISELKDLIIRSAVDGDFDTCDEIMEVVASKADEDTYRGMVSNYFKILTDIGSARDMMKCAYEDADQFVKSPTSLYPIHKKLGRPITELVRDASGEYHLRSTYHARQNLEEEGAFFSNAKVLFGGDK